MTKSSQNTINHLKELSDNEIIRLNNERKVIESVHSNLDLLIKRYNIEKSYFGQISHWYGSRPWWAKILLLIAIITIGIGLGFACHIPITLSLTTGIIYFSCTFLLTNHYKITKKQTKLLCEDIIELEKSLETSVKHFNCINENIKKILTDLHTINSQLLTELQKFTNEVTILTNKVSEYKKIIEELNKTKNKIITATDNIANEINNNITQYKQCCATITNTAQTVNDISNNLTKTNTYLSNETTMLHDIVIKYQAKLEFITNIAHKMTLIAPETPKNLDNSNKNSQTQIQKKPDTINNTYSSKSRTDDNDSEKKSQDILQKARIARQQSSNLRQRIANFLTNEQPNPHTQATQ